MSKKGGGYNLCAALYCNQNRKRNPNLSFFRFPKNPKTCRQWIINAKRFDLLHKEPSYLYSNCILCSDHFEESMFTSQLKNRLLDMAIPTKFAITIDPDKNKLLNTMGDDICKQITEQREGGKNIKEVIKANVPMMTTSIFSKSKNLLSTKTLTISTKPRIITTQIPSTSFNTSSIMKLANTMKPITQTTNTTNSNTSTSVEKPKLIWVTGLPMNSSTKFINQPNKTVSIVNPTLKTISSNDDSPTTANTTELFSSPVGKTINSGEEAEVSLLPDVKLEVPGGEDSGQNYSSIADYSNYPSSSFDGSHYNSNVLQDNSNTYCSYDNNQSYDANYESSTAPPPSKKKKVAPNSRNVENLNDNYQAFSELIVAKLKYLPPNRASILQLKIQELLSQEISDLENELVVLENDTDDTNEPEITEENIDIKPEFEEPSHPPDQTNASKGHNTETTEVLQQTTTTTTTETTTIAKKRKMTLLDLQNYIHNKENSKIYLDDSYKAFSKCIVSQLRYLPVPIAVKTQDKIQKVISDEIADYYNKAHPGEVIVPNDTNELLTPSVEIKEEPNDL